MNNRLNVFKDAKMCEKYYAVHCKCGHVGTNHYVEIVFAVRAINGRAAASIARRFARVKHNKKNAIINCYEISRDEYEKLIETNKNDPYLKCKNIQEQRMIEGFDSRIRSEPKENTFKKNKAERKSFVAYKLKRHKEIIEGLMMGNV